MNITKILALQILLIFFALSGCSGQDSNEKLTSENIRTIKAGMDQPTVEEILGGAKPYKIVKDPSVKEHSTHFFRGKRMSATVLYVDNEVASVMLNGVKVAN